jgi:DNA-binding NtrC family response regulator
MKHLARKWLSKLHMSPSRDGHAIESAQAVSTLAEASERIALLAITLSRQHARLLETISRNQGWDFLDARSWREAVEILSDQRTGIVLLDREMLGINWKDAVGLLLHAAHRCCVILMTPTTEDRFCEQFLREGGYKVLKTPLGESEVVEARPTRMGVLKDAHRRRISILRHNVPHVR